MTQLTEDQARQMFTVVNSRNVDKIVEQYADDATFQVPTTATPLRGKDAIRGFLSGSFAAFPDWTTDVSKVYVSGNDVVVVNSVRGTHTGPLTMTDGQTIAATNKKFVQSQVTRVVLNEKGQVLSLHAYGHPADLAQQLGIAKETAQAVDTRVCSRSLSQPLTRPFGPGPIHHDVTTTRPLLRRTIHRAASRRLP